MDTLYNHLSNEDMDALRDHLRDLAIDRLGEGVGPGRRLSTQQTRTLLEGLPSLTEQDLRKSGQHDAICPICFTPFLALLSEEETAIAMDSPAHPIEELGVTKLQRCGHVYCRKDIRKWVEGGRDSCPLCRRKFVEDNEAGQPEATSEEALTPADAEARATELQEFFRSILNSNNVGAAPSFQRRDNNRNEFSGMYS